MTHWHAVLVVAAAGCASSVEPGSAATRGDVEIMQLPSSSASSSSARLVPERPRRSARGHWYTDEAEAVELAHEERRPLIVDFAASWCQACKELQKHTFEDEGVKRSLDRFVLLRLDVTDEDNPTTQFLFVKYKVVGLPAVLLIDSTSNEAGRITEFVQPDQMRGALDAVP